MRRVARGERERETLPDGCLALDSTRLERERESFSRACRRFVKDTRYTNFVETSSSTRERVPSHALIDILGVDEFYVS